MEQLTSEIHAMFDAFKNESNIFVEKGNKAAAARARKISLELTALLKQFRKESI